ncbi:MAG TPA: adenylate/guanylate cyclase domain-containing protein, partial [Solirubrobacteraceae bacterium]
MPPWGPRWPTPELHGGTVTFLFTDIEGSTRLLKERGARYGQLLAEHQRILRAACAANDGHEIDTQGDSFFFAFRRAKDALAAALDGQRALAAHSWPDGAEPRVRMGLHSGEPVLGDGRYMGIGVHRAARIGAAAHGGQVLLSSSTRELVEDDLPAGVSLRELGLVRLKDIDRPERLSQLVGDGLRAEFPPLRGAEPVLPPRAPRRRSLLLAALAGVVAAAVAIPVFALGRGSGGSKGLARIGANAVGAVDPSSGDLLASIPVGATPGSLAYGAGSLWVTNNDAHSVSRIDPKTNAVVQTIQVGSGPAGVAVAGGFVWVTNSLDGTVSKIDPNDNNGTVVATPLVGNRPTGIASDGSSLWVADSGDGTMVRIAPRTATVTKTIPVGAGADAVAVGGGLVWVTSESGNSVTRINARSGTVLPPIDVGNGPSAVSLGAGAAWVANTSTERSR